MTFRASRSRSAPETWALDDSGTALVRVRKTERYGRCDGYTLSVKIE